MSPVWLHGGSTVVVIPEKGENSTITRPDRSTAKAPALPKVQASITKVREAITRGPKAAIPTCSSVDEITKQRGRECLGWALI